MSGFVGFFLEKLIFLYHSSSPFLEWSRQNDDRWGWELLRGHHMHQSRMAGRGLNRSERDFGCSDWWGCDCSQTLFTNSAE